MFSAVSVVLVGGTCCEPLFFSSSRTKKAKAETSMLNYPFTPAYSDLVKKGNWTKGCVWAGGEKKGGQEEKTGTKERDRFETLERAGGRVNCSE